MDFEDTFIGRPNTVKAYTSLFRNHIKDIEPKVSWAEWDENETIECLNTWEWDRLSRKTRQSLLSLLSRYIEFMGGPMIKTRHFARILERGEQQKEPSILNKIEAEALMKNCKKLAPSFYPILLLALHAGLRRGEIFGLTCEDINVLKGRIRVAHSYNGPTKSGKTRFVPMSGALLKEMTKARNLLFRPTTNKVFEQMNPNPVLHHLLIQTGLNPIRFHDLRHTFATMALENGVSPRQVAAWLGHSSVTTTLSIYWNLTKDEFDLDSFLPGGTI